MRAKRTYRLFVSVPGRGIQIAAALCPVIFLMVGSNIVVIIIPDPHRAIGVVYHPHYEQFGNYVPSIMPERYDAFILLDQTGGLHAMEVYVDKGQLPETYPWVF